MLSFQVMNLRAACLLGLALLVMFPGAAAARRRSQLDSGSDPLCERARGLVCQKLRVGVVGAGILSTDGALPGIGFKGGYFWVLGPGLEVGFDALMVKDVRLSEGPYLFSMEGMLRFTTFESGDQRLFVELSVGGSRYEAPELAYWAFPSGGVGASYELSGTQMGVFLTAGLSLMYAEGLTALPHAGVGVVF
ncbi:MAG: hypothetical protein JXB05_22995 [Myxococcaceae bacterium]|nr:hypothetical protein [Myxococcaceae bacterium]